MKLFKYELKKIWNWRILLIVGVMGALAWFAMLSDTFRSYDSLTTHGIYGAYQNEMFEQYGDTLESEELAAFDIPGKKARVLTELDNIIATESIFKDNDIANYSEYETFLDEVHSRELDSKEEEKLSELTYLMQQKLVNHAQTVEESYASPLGKLNSLVALEHTYLKYEGNLRNYIDYDTRPIVVQAAEKLVEMNNSNLIRYDLTESFSQYVMVVSVFSIIAVILMVAPLLTTDRMSGIHFIQYSATIGRKIFRIQFAVTILSALLLSILLVVLAYIPFMAIGGIEYWNASIMSFHFGAAGMQLYDVTFGQYACILAGVVILLNIGSASLAFVLARFSQNIIVMMMKAVPLAIAIIGIAILSITNMFSNNNIIFTMLFSGKVYAPEVIICVLIALVGLVIVSIVLKREKRVDIT